MEATNEKFHNLNSVNNKWLIFQSILKSGGSTTRLVVIY